MVENNQYDASIQSNYNLISLIYGKLHELENELGKLKKEKIIDETKIPIEILKNSGIVNDKEIITKQRSNRPLLKSEIEEARKYSIYAKSQAKWLGICYNTYKKYCKMYNIWNPIPSKRGKTCNYDPNSGKYPLSKILGGSFNNNPKISDWLVKRKLFKSKIFPLHCDQCGYNRKRLIDKYPLLLLDHKDGDKGNFKKDNLRFLCWNCTVECGRGYLKKGFKTIDHNW